MAYYQDPRDPYYNNVSGDQSGSYRGEYAGRHQQGQSARNYINPQMQENDHPYSTKGTPSGRAEEDNDNASVVSSVYSQPSVVGSMPSNKMRYYQGQSNSREKDSMSLAYNEPPYPLENNHQMYNEPPYHNNNQIPLTYNEPPYHNNNQIPLTYNEPPYHNNNQMSLTYNEPPLHHEDDPMDYPPSPLADSTNSAIGLTAVSSKQGLQSFDQYEENYIPDYMEENHYHDFSQNPQSQFDAYNNSSQPQFDIYNDFNNKIRKDETYDEEGTRNNTPTGTNGPHDSNSYTMNLDYNDTEKVNRHSGQHFVVSKKDRRCFCCSRKICVIISFVILVLLSTGMYFIWPRIPQIKILSPTPMGNAEITLNPVAAKLGMNLQIELDNRENWLPYKFNSLNVNVYNAARINSYNRALATSNKKKFSIPGRAKSTISVPISIEYLGSEPNDPIVQDFISACTQPPEGDRKANLNLRFELKIFILGLDWIYKPTKIIPTSEFQCPFEAKRPSLDELPPVTNEQPVDPSTEPPVNPAVPAPKQPAVPAPEPPKQPADPAKVPPKQPADPAKEPPKQPEDPAPPVNPAK